MELILRANDEAGQRVVDGYYKIVAQQKLDEQDWISKLRGQGVKACHPNDGWVNRNDNKIHLCYPLFNDGVGVGDKIMLGWVNDKKSERLVEVTEIENSLLTYYHFKDVREAINFIPEKQQELPTKNGRSIFYIACYKLAVLFGFVR